MGRVHARLVLAVLLALGCGAAADDGGEDWGGGGGDWGEEPPAAAPAPPSVAPVPAIGTHEADCRGKRFVVGVPEGWVAAEAVVAEGVLVAVADGPGTSPRAQLAVLATADPGAERGATFTELSAAASDHAAKRGWKPRGGASAFEPRWTTLGGYGAALVPVEMAAQDPSRPATPGFVAVVKAGGLRLLLVGRATADAFAAAEVPLLLAAQGLSLPGAPPPTVLRPAVLGPRPPGSPGARPLEGFYWRRETVVVWNRRTHLHEDQVRDRYLAFRADGLVARAGSPFPVPFESFSFERASALDPVQVGFYVAGEGVTVRFPGEAEASTVDLAGFRRLDVALDAAAVAGRWTYGSVRSYGEPGQSLRQSERYRTLVLKPDGAFEEESSYGFFASDRVETPVPDARGGGTEPRTAEAESTGSATKEERRRGRYRLGRGTLSLEDEPAAGTAGGLPRVVVCVPDGDTLYLGGVAYLRTSGSE